MRKNVAQHEELRKAALPLIKFLNENFCPCAKAIVTPEGVEITEGVMTYKTNELTKN